jgi:hypothetical protein
MTDYTLNAVRAQLYAMNCDKYKIGIYHRKNKSMENRFCVDYDYIINSIQWLKYQNLNDNDIFIGQANDIDRALILVDDLSDHQISLMTKRGVSPACVVETSPNNFQAWVSLGMEPMSKAQRKIISITFAKEFNGDLSSTDANHYGRLAGFTNRKVEYLNEKGYPFVYCKKSTGEHAEKSDKIRAWAIAQEEKENQKQSIISTNNIVVSRNKTKPKIEAEKAFVLYWDKWLKAISYMKKSEDLSRGDFAVASRMLKEGFSKVEIIKAMAILSPDINIRKKNHIDDYVARTVDAAEKNLLNIRASVFMK